MKRKRQLAILNLIEKEDISTQEELSKRLTELGFNVTQATVSRDIKELKLLKVPSGIKGTKYGFSGDSLAKNGSSPHKFNVIMSQAVLNCDYANNMVIVKTMQGMAQGVAFVIDSLNDKSIMGSIAGDDTIFIVTKTEELAMALCDVIKNL
ncbi:MAG: arginine repressor [Clostridia bacterium]|nr:arginine repressor [Clostridia bacterium]